jgi:hypothetical protein
MSNLLFVTSHSRAWLIRRIHQQGRLIFETWQSNSPRYLSQPDGNISVAKFIDGYTVSTNQDQISTGDRRTSWRSHRLHVHTVDGVESEANHIIFFRHLFYFSYVDKCIVVWVSFSPHVGDANLCLCACLGTAGGIDMYLRHPEI